MFYHTIIAFVHCIWVVVCIASPQNEPQPVPSELFNSLEELSRLVDIAYCVGTTGVQEPFQCLSHCAEFPDLQLLTVSFLECKSKSELTIRKSSHLLDMEHRRSLIRLMWVHGHLPHPGGEAYRPGLPGNLLDHQHYHRSLRIPSGLCTLHRRRRGRRTREWIRASAPGSEVQELHCTCWVHEIVVEHPLCGATTANSCS